MARTTTTEKVRELQRTLYRTAKADPHRRFHALYDKVYRRDVLERAWDQVRRRSGHGYRNFENYRLRLLLNHGVKWDTQPTTKIRGRKPPLVA